MPHTSSTNEKLPLSKLALAIKQQEFSAIDELLRTGYDYESEWQLFLADLKQEKGSPKSSIALAIGLLDSSNDIVRNNASKILRALLGRVVKEKDGLQLVYLYAERYAEGLNYRKQHCLHHFFKLCTQCILDTEDIEFLTSLNQKAIYKEAAYAPVWRELFYEACANRKLALIDFFLAPTTEVEKLWLFSYSALYDQGKTPLHVAVEKGNVEVVKKLIQAGAKNIHQPMLNAAERTPFKMALNGANRSEEAKTIWRMLQAAGRNISSNFTMSFLPNVKGITAISQAVEEGNQDMLSLLLEDASEEELIYYPDRGEGIYFPLHIAAHLGRADMIALLLAKKADPDARSLTLEAVKPLRLAVEACRLEAIKQLFPLTNHPFEQDKRGINILHVAVEKHMVEIIDYLIKSDKQLQAVNAQDHHQESPLGLAIRKVSTEVVRMFLDAGAQVTDRELLSINASLPDDLLQRVFDRWLHSLQVDKDGRNINMLALNHALQHIQQRPLLSAAALKHLQANYPMLYLERMPSGMWQAVRVTQRFNAPFTEVLGTIQRTHLHQKRKKINASKPVFDEPGFDTRDNTAARYKKQLEEMFGEFTPVMESVFKQVQFLKKTIHLTKPGNVKSIMDQGTIFSKRALSQQKITYIRGIADDDEDVLRQDGTLVCTTPFLPWGGPEEAVYNQKKDDIYGKLSEFAAIVFNVPRLMQYRKIAEKVFFKTADWAAFYYPDEYNIREIFLASCSEGDVYLRTAYQPPLSKVMTMQEYGYYFTLKREGAVIEDRKTNVLPSRDVYHGFEGLEEYVASRIFYLIGFDDLVRKQVVEGLQTMYAQKQEEGLIQHIEDIAAKICANSELDFLHSLAFPLEAVERIDFRDKGTVEVAVIINDISQGKRDSLQAAFTEHPWLKECHFFVKRLIATAYKYEQHQLVDYIEEECAALLGIARKKESKHSLQHSEDPGHWQARVTKPAAAAVNLLPIFKENAAITQSSVDALQLHANSLSASLFNVPGWEENQHLLHSMIKFYESHPLERRKLLEDKSLASRVVTLKQQMLPFFQDGSLATDEGIQFAGLYSKQRQFVREPKWIEQLTGANAAVMRYILAEEAEIRSNAQFNVQQAPGFLTLSISPITGDNRAITIGKLLVGVMEKTAAFVAYQPLNTEGKEWEPLLQKGDSIALRHQCLSQFIEGVEQARQTLPLLTQTIKELHGLLGLIPASKREDGLYYQPNRWHSYYQRIAHFWDPKKKEEFYQKVQSFGPQYEITRGKEAFFPALFGKDRVQYMPEGRIAIAMSFSEAVERFLTSDILLQQPGSHFFFDPMHMACLLFHQNLDLPSFTFKDQSAPIGMREFLHETVKFLATHPYKEDYAITASQLFLRLQGAADKMQERGFLEPAVKHSVGKEEVPAR